MNLTSLKIHLLTVIMFFALWTPMEASAQPSWLQAESIQAVLQGAAPIQPGVRLDIPAVTQDGSSVQVSIEVESPMTPDDYIDRIHLFALENPSPELIELSLTPLAGKARVTTRIRLDQSQTVVALARRSSGEWLAAARDVRVTVSGCLSREGTYRSEHVMQARVRVPERGRKGSPMEVRTLIQHPMETGLRKDSDGSAIPERIIKQFEAAIDGDRVIVARLHRAMAANPYLLFTIAPEQSGELVMTWTEDTAATVTETAQFEIR